MQASIFPCEVNDVKRLAKEIIEADRQEILALGLDVEFALLTTLGRSVEAYAIYIGEDLAACFGVTKAGELVPEYHAWMISTPVIFKHKRDLLPVSKRVVQWMLVRFGQVSNHVDARHTKAIRWLKWLGAEVGPAQPFGPYRRPFHKFTLGTPHVP